ncbi:hypothetical protein AGR7B_Lc110017 [Agrobacterium deltaense RV3]|nr:hypothetical protein AGR7B_Lc110017 [Agrobacterium deltaense RV3]
MSAIQPDKSLEEIRTPDAPFHSHAVERNPNQHQCHYRSPMAQAYLFSKAEPMIFRERTTPKNRHNPFVT